MLAIVDYGMGNLRSVQKALEKVGMDAEITGETRDLETAQALVLPGVGAFGKAMSHLESRGLVDPILRHIERGKPFLGICLGLQLLFEQSEERFDGRGFEDPAGFPRGLAIFPGWVRRFPTGSKVPQIGWNQLHIKKPSPLFDGVPEGTYVYFVHSYYAQPAEESIVTTTTDYGLDYCSSIQKDNVLAVQYHPEKSSQVGQRILHNFKGLVAQA